MVLRGDVLVLIERPHGDGWAVLRPAWHAAGAPPLRESRALVATRRLKF